MGKQTYIIHTSGGGKTDFYRLSSDELNILLRAVSELRVNGGKWSELDYYYNIAWNVEYSEKSAIY